MMIIVPHQNLVQIDGIGFTVDCSMIDPSIHVVRWYDKKSSGEIEYADRPSKPITDIAMFRDYTEAWRGIKSRWEAPPDSNHVWNPIENDWVHVEAGS